MGKVSSRAGRTFEIPLGFYIPGMFAWCVRKGIQLGHPRKQIVDHFEKIQGLSRVDCPECGHEEAPVVVWTRRQIVDLYRMATSMTYSDFLAVVEQQYREFVFTCPKRGMEASFLDHTLDKAKRRGHRHLGRRPATATATRTAPSARS
jgi:hypothetical protein